VFRICNFYCCESDGKLIDSLLKYAYQDPGNSNNYGKLSYWYRQLLESYLFYEIVATGTAFNRTVPTVSVADPGCLSRIPDLDFYPSRIPDLGSRIPDPKTGRKERGEKNFLVKHFFVATNFTKCKII
jgi:hypothetical protein